MSEMDILEQGLIERGIPYDRHPLYSGEQIDTEDWDAICHEYSYGGCDGLLEIMGSIVTGGDTVEGYLTAEEILARLPR